MDDQIKIDSMCEKVCRKMRDAFLKNVANVPSMNDMDFINFHMKIVSIISLTIISGMENSMNTHGTEIDVPMLMDALTADMKHNYLKYKSIVSNTFHNVDLHATNTIN